MPGDRSRGNESPLRPGQAPRDGRLPGVGLVLAVVHVQLDHLLLELQEQQDLDPAQRRVAPPVQCTTRTYRRVENITENLSATSVETQPGWLPTYRVAGLLMRRLCPCLVITLPLGVTWAGTDQALSACMRDGLLHDDGPVNKRQDRSLLMSPLQHPGPARPRNYADRRSVPRDRAQPCTRSGACGT